MWGRQQIMCLYIKPATTSSLSPTLPPLTWPQYRTDPLMSILLHRHYIKHVCNMVVEKYNACSYVRLKAFFNIIPSKGCTWAVEIMINYLCPRTCMVNSVKNISHQIVYEIYRLQTVCHPSSGVYDFQCSSRCLTLRQSWKTHTLIPKHCGFQLSYWIFLNEK